MLTAKKFMAGAVGLVLALPLMLTLVVYASLHATMDAFDEWADGLPFWGAFKLSFKQNCR